MPSTVFPILFLGKLKCYNVDHNDCIFKSRIIKYGVPQSSTCVNNLSSCEPNRNVILYVTLPQVMGMNRHKMSFSNKVLLTSLHVCLRRCEVFESFWELHIDYLIKCLFTVRHLKDNTSRKT